MVIAMCICFIVTFALAVLVGPIYIPMLKKLKFGQTIRDNGPQTHLAKQGTPTIGGIIFLTAVLPCTIYIGFSKGYTDIFVMLITVLAFALVGFLDDFLKIKRKSKDGLNPKQKMLLLILVSAAFACYMYFIADYNTVVIIDLFVKTIKFDIGWAYIPLIIIVLISVTNAVNLTDGLDGLCAGSSLLVFAFFAAASYFKIHNDNVMFFSVIFTGALLGFLIYNYKPAKVFMGDTGSLALGSAIGICAIAINRPLMLLLVGLLFVIEALSVIMQVSYFKITHGKRIFKMSPIHHHFELSGWSEKKVVHVFWTFTLFCCVIAYFALA